MQSRLDASVMSKGVLARMESTCLTFHRTQIFDHGQTYLGRVEFARQFVQYRLAIGFS